jgi:hypothetical protein
LGGGPRRLLTRPTVADEKTRFADAILNKMVREIAGRPQWNAVGLPVSGQ